MQAAVSYSMFQQNDANFGGGAFVGVNATLILSRDNFTANQAVTSGGGTYLSIDSTLTATSCAFTGNNADSGSGLFCDSCAMWADMLLVTNNKAVDSGGGLGAINQAQVTTYMNSNL